jgi:hypothetical protein
LAAESPKDALGDSTACAVCLLELGPDDMVRGLRQCGHAFHRDCLDGWFDSASTSALSPTCPLCRAPCHGEDGGCKGNLSPAAIQIHFDADDENQISGGGGGGANPEPPVGDYVVVNARERMYQI